MKILLLGEYSGLYSNLKDGLKELGHDVRLAASGDSWKRIKSDIRFDADVPFLVNKFVTNIKPFFLLKKLCDYDIVQVINPLILYRKFGINKKFLLWIFKHNRKIFLSAAGDDAFYANAVNLSKFRYSPLPDYISLDLAGRAFPYLEDAVIQWNEYVANRVDGVIPIAFEYAEAYRDHVNSRPMIPMPININKIKYKENVIRNKIVIYHGINRPGFKGTHYIREAFVEARNKYPNDLELILADSLPYDQYLDVIRRTNVIVDQTSSYSCGMNALLSMAMGKVVMGGNEPESTSEFTNDISPVINILPDPIDIKNKIECLLDNKIKIPEIGHLSRIFIESNHDYIKIAEKYVRAWAA